jgi:hypothetical protein
VAVPHLTVLSSPEFPQLFDYEVRRVARIMQQTYEQIFLRRCDWQDEYCDCKEQGTVHDLKSEQEFCARHFRLVEYRRDTQTGEK